MKISVELLPKVRIKNGNFYYYKNQGTDHNALFRLRIEGPASE